MMYLHHSTWKECWTSQDIEEVKKYKDKEPSRTDHAIYVKVLGELTLHQGKMYVKTKYQSATITARRQH